MFAEMRNTLGIPKTTDILNHIYSLPTATAQSLAMTQIRTIESRAMASQIPQPGLLPLMAYLESRSIPKALCTRNFDGPVTHLLGKFLPEKKFHPIVTREFRPPKPAPDGIWFIARAWGLHRELGERSEHGENGEETKHGEEIKQGKHSEETKQSQPTTQTQPAPNQAKSLSLPLIMVGDNLDDMTAGYTAGAATVLLVNDVNAHLATHEHTDFCIRRLDELIELLEGGFVGRGGREGGGDGEEVMRVFIDRERGFEGFR
jgi:phosphoglycolate phosphatase-like HAD superfamily hydrolase